MSFYNIEVKYTGGFNIIFEEEQSVIIPSFNVIVTNDAYSWCGLYYVFLFNSYSPFGYIKNLDERDQHVCNALYSNPRLRGGKRDVSKFYKTKLFKAATKDFKRLYKQDAFEEYMMQRRKYQELMELMEGNKIKDAESVIHYDEYLKAFTNIKAAIKVAEKELSEHIQSGGTKEGLASFMDIYDEDDL